MGHKSRRRRREHAVACHPEPAVVRQAPPTAPVSLFGGGWFTRFAVVFLIIFVLLWLFAPQEPQHRE